MERTNPNSSDFQNSPRVNCFITLVDEEVILTATTSSVGSIQALKDRMDLRVRGEIVFDGNRYVGLNSENHKKEIEIIFLKEEVFDLLPIILKSCLGGLVVLSFITFILYKCGFFKRDKKYMTDQEQENE